MKTGRPLPDRVGAYGCACRGYRKRGVGQLAGLEILAVQEAFVQGGGEPTRRTPRKGIAGERQGSRRSEAIRRRALSERTLRRSRSIPPRPRDRGHHRLDGAGRAGHDLTRHPRRARRAAPRASARRFVTSVGVDARNVEKRFTRDDRVTQPPRGERNSVRRAAVPRSTMSSRDGWIRRRSAPGRPSAIAGSPRRESTRCAPPERRDRDGECEAVADLTSWSMLRRVRRLHPTSRSDRDAPSCESARCC